MASLANFRPSPLPQTLSKPYKTRTLESRTSSYKPSPFKKTKSSQISSSLSENRPFSASAAEVPQDFTSGTAFLSSVLATLVWILESRRKGHLSLPHRSINRQCYDLRRRSVEVGSWKLSLDVFPSIRESYDHPAAVIDPAFLGIVKSADRVASGIRESHERPTVAAFLGIVKSADCVAFGIQEPYKPPTVVTDPEYMGIVKSADCFRMSYDHPPVAIDPAFLGIVKLADRVAYWSSVCRNYSVLGSVDINSEPLNSSDEEEGKLGGLNGSMSIQSQLLLPIRSAACLEIPSSSVISITEQEKSSGKRALQAAIPAIAMVAGAFGAITAGVNGGLEMVGFVAIGSFLVHDLPWASNRRMLWEDLVKVTDREKLIFFLKSRNMMILNL